MEKWDDTPEPMVLLDNFEPAQWIAEGISPLDAKAWPDEHCRRAWSRRLGLGNPGFPAYTRLMFLPDPKYRGQPDSEIDRTWWERLQGDLTQLEWAVGDLLPFTSSPTLGYLALWEGSGAIADNLNEKRKFELPGRAYHIFQVSLLDFASGLIGRYWQTTGGVWAQDRAFGRPTLPAPAFIWPADHAWMIAKDVDPHYAGIGGTESAIAALEADDRLVLIRTEYNATIPSWYESGWD